MKNNIQELPIRSLKLNELNAKKHPRDQVLAIAKSIRRYGFVAPIIVDSNYRVLAGHGRIQAATEIGLDSVPAIIADHLTELGQDQTTERSKRATQQRQQDVARDNKAKIPTYILVPLGQDTNRKLKSYARQHDTTAGEAAAELIAKALAGPQGLE